MGIPIEASEVDRRWSRVQAVTGLLFGLFVSAHLVNTIFALFGAKAYNSLQLFFSSAYQNLVVEVVLLGVVLPLHIAAGIKRSKLRRLHREPAGKSLVWHRRAGWFLVVIVYWHAAAVRLPALLFDARPGFDGVAFAIEWAPLWFYPYYFLLALAGCYHLVSGSLLAMSRLGWRARPLQRRQRLRLGVASSVVLVTVLLAFGGHLFAIDDPMRSRYAQVTLSIYERLIE